MGDYYDWNVTDGVDTSIDKMIKFLDTCEILEDDEKGIDGMNYKCWMDMFDYSEDQLISDVETLREFSKLRKPGEKVVLKPLPY